MPSPPSWAIHYHQSPENASRNGSNIMQFKIPLIFGSTDDIKLLQEYDESNGSVVYLPSSTFKSLISLWNYIYLLIKRERPVDQKYNVLYFLLDDQWFNLTANDMKTTLDNAGMDYHEPQIFHGTSLPNSTSLHLLCL